MATGIGACMVLCISTFNRSLLAATMAFSAGVMVYVSLVEVVAVSSDYASATASFFVGALVMAAVDRLGVVVLPGLVGNGGSAAHLLLSQAHSILAVAAIEEKQRLLTMAAVVSAAIALHNLPEGMATVTAAETTRSQKKALPALGLASLASPNNCSQLACAQVAAGLPLAIAIAIHNIPEGLAIAMPIFYATHSRWRAI
ncbi:MAG: hypothetical protein SGPRY_008604, partial [Prymnesium sp.]